MRLWRKEKVIFLIGMVLIFALVTVGCGGEEPTAGKDTAELGQERIRISVCNAMDHPQTIGLLLFKQLVEEESGGNIEVAIHPNSELGGERESLEQVQSGSLEMATASAGPLATFNSEFMVLDIPFAFDDYETAWMIMDGSTGQKLLSSGESVGFKGLAYMENGFRHITNTVRPVRQPSDLDGIKIRTMEAPMHMENFQVLGANPTPVPWTELYLSLQQRIVDGQENPIANMWELTMYEVQDYVSLTGHIYDPMALVANLDWFNGLPLEYQKLIERSAILAQNYSRMVNKQREDLLLELLSENGMEINELTPAEKEQFRSTSQPVIIEKIKGEIDSSFVDAWLQAIDDVENDIVAGI